MSRRHRRSGKQVLLWCVILLLILVLWHNIKGRLGGSVTPPTHISDITGLDIPSYTGTIYTHTGYKFGYNSTLFNPDWVGYELTAAEAKGTYTRSDDFRPDPTVNGGTATPGMYTRSGFDRGHLAPSADMKWSEQAQSESFYMSNICPMTPELNRGPWEHLEEFTRHWAEHDGTVYVVTGPVWEKANHNTLKSTRVAVPEKFFKVVYSPQQYKALGFIMPNGNPDKDFATYATSVDQVETITGYDFFAALPDSVENRIESTTQFPAGVNR